MDNERGSHVAYQISISLKELAKVIRLRASVETAITGLQQMGFSCTLEERIIGDRHFFLCVSGRRSRGQERELRKQLGEGIAEYICDCQEPEMIRHIIRQEFHIQQAKEMAQIENHASRLLEETDWGYARVLYANRRQKLAREVTAFLKESKKLAVDGFVHFRMRRHRKALTKCVKDAVDEYLLDKEYKEFIQLLKYFVSVQTSKIDLVHVIHEGRRSFRILKEDGTPLKLQEMDGALQEVIEHTFSHEDFIVSTLLTVAPERVILHTKYPEENVVRTLIQIFEGRIVVCNGCKDCGIPLNFHGDA